MKQWITEEFQVTCPILLILPPSQPVLPFFLFPQHKLIALFSFFPKILLVFKDLSQSSLNFPFQTSLLLFANTGKVNYCLPKMTHVYCFIGDRLVYSP